MRGLAIPHEPRLLVGTATGDDAAVFRLRDDLALVQTVDFFTPIVDDPFDFGRIAAANALSDVYAMGGTPLTALNLVAFPLEQLGGDVLRQILEGGLTIAAQAGCAIVGGHSIDDPEPKYGLAVTGTVDPSRMLTNAGARAGDVLVLTKPLGVGALTTAGKRGAAGGVELAAAVETMVTLNAAASKQALGAEAGAATDVTGFGLLGHLHNLARESGLAAEVRAHDVPALPGALEALGDGVGVSGGGRRNRDTPTRSGCSIRESATPTGRSCAIPPPPAACSWRCRASAPPSSTASSSGGCSRDRRVRSRFYSRRPERPGPVPHPAFKAGEPRRSRGGKVRLLRRSASPT